LGALGLVLLVALAAGSLGTSVFRRYALSNGLLDFPNERSAHTRPVPRGGGVAIVLTILVGIVTGALLGFIPSKTAGALVGGAILVSLVGWIDDRKSLPTRIRLAAQLGAATWTVVLLQGYLRINLGWSAAELGVAGSVLAAVGIMWGTNFFNFMDGVDGLAAVEAVMVGLAGGGMLLWDGHPQLALIAFLVAGAAAGFLRWNWHPAQVFMGDVGSTTLGFLFCSLAVASENAGSVSLFTWGTLLGVFVFDPTLTLVRRLRYGNRWSTPHLDFAFHRAVRDGRSHSQVTTGVVTINLVLTALAVLGWAFPRLLLPTVGFGIVFLSLIYWKLESLFPMYRGAEPTRSRLSDPGISLVPDVPGRIDPTALEAIVHGRTVMVAGVAGELGRELCRQLPGLSPSRLVLLARDDESLAACTEELSTALPRLPISPVLCDLRDRARLRQVLKRFQPATVFHAACQRQVQLAEQNLAETIIANVLGTSVLVELAVAADVERLIFLSALEAGCAGNVMAATHSVAEQIVLDAATRHGRKLVVVRVGSLLGPRGSLELSLQRKIQAGGPVLIKHPRFSPRLRTAPQAVQLALQAAAMGEGGEVFVVDAGPPTPLLDIVHRLIHEAGLTVGKDIHIRFGGIGPNEPLTGERFGAVTDMHPTSHPLIARSAMSPAGSRLELLLDDLVRAALNGAEDLQRLLLSWLVPDFAQAMRPVIQAEGQAHASLRARPTELLHHKGPRELSGQS
jgi:Fuc2NAc and GlcNAc transferase